MGGHYWFIGTNREDRIYRIIYFGSKFKLDRKNGYFGRVKSLFWIGENIVILHWKTIYFGLVNFKTKNLENFTVILKF